MIHPKLKIEKTVLIIFFLFVALDITSHFIFAPPPPPPKEQAKPTEKPKVEDGEESIISQDTKEEKEDTE